MRRLRMANVIWLIGLTLTLVACSGFLPQLAPKPSNYKRVYLSNLTPAEEQQCRYKRGLGEADDCIESNLLLRAKKYYPYVGIYDISECKKVGAYVPCLDARNEERRDRASKPLEEQHKASYVELTERGQFKWLSFASYMSCKSRFLPGHDQGFWECIHKSNRSDAPPELIARQEKEAKALAEHANQVAEETRRKLAQEQSEFRRNIKIGAYCWVGPFSGSSRATSRLPVKNVFLHGLVVDVKPEIVRVQYDGKWSHGTGWFDGDLEHAEWVKREMVYSKDQW